MRKRSVSTNTVIVLIGQGLSLFTTLLLTPIQLSEMGLEKYGLLTLVISVVGLATVLDFGLGWASLHFMPQTGSIEDSRALASRVLLSGLGLGLIAAVIPAVVIPLVAPGTPISIVVLGSLLVPATVIVNCLYSLIRSTGDFVRSTVIATTTVVTSNVVWALSAGDAYDVQIVLAWLIGLAVCASLYMWFRVRSARPVHLNESVDTTNVLPRVSTRTLLQFSATSSLLGVSTVLATTADKVVMGAAVGVATLPLYSVSVALAARITIFSSALTAVAFPRLSQAQGQGDEQTARTLAQRVLVSTAALSATLAVAMVLAGPTFFSVWISPEFADSTTWIVRPLAIGFAIYGIGQLGFAANDARGLVGRSSRANLLVIIPTLALTAAVAATRGVVAGSFTFALGIAVIGGIGVWLGGDYRALASPFAVTLISVPILVSLAVWSVLAAVHAPATLELVIFAVCLAPVLLWQLQLLRRPTVLRA